MMQSFEFESGGERVRAMLHLPDNGDKIPAVLMIPGFADTACGMHNMHIYTARELYGAGFAVLRFDYKGLGKSDGDFSRFTVRTGLDDAKAALEALRANPRIDPSRIGVTGFSLGGALAARLAADTGAVKALALWAPVAFMHSVFSDFFSDDHKRQAREQGWIDWMGWPVGESYLSTLSDIDPIDAFRRANIPALVIHGTKDTEVPVANAEAYVQEGAVVQWIEGGDHLFSSVRLTERAAAFTKEWFWNLL